MSARAAAERVAARITQLAAIPVPPRGAIARVLCAHARRLPIPVDTGRLRASLTVPGHPEQRVGVQRAPRGWSATLASEVPYAQYQIPRARRGAATLDVGALRALLPRSPQR